MNDRIYTICICEVGDFVLENARNKEDAFYPQISYLKFSGFLSSNLRKFELNHLNQNPSVKNFTENLFYLIYF